MEDTKTRLDLKVAEIKNISRNKAKELIINSLVEVNGIKITKPSEYVNDNDVLGILSMNEKVFIPLQAIKKKIDILYEDEYLLIVNKPSGLLTHPTNNDENDTLANFLKYYFTQNNIKSDFDSDDKRCGICHRLDKNTAGLIIVAKSKKSFDAISKMIANKEIERLYLALVWKNLKTNVIKADLPIKRLNGSNERIVSSNNDAKDCVTYFTELEKYKGFSLIECKLETGRTHQIRVHLKYIGNPIINDPVYGKDKNTTNYCQYLFANKLSFIHPFTKKSILINLKIPKEFLHYIKENE